MRCSQHRFSININGAAMYSIITVTAYGKPPILRHFLRLIGRILEILEILRSFVNREREREREREEYKFDTDLKEFLATIDG